MKIQVKTFRLFVKPDAKSQQIADKIRKLNSNLSTPLTESDDGDLVIAIGGDGTFIDAVTSTKFSKEKIYTGIHTGKVGFLQDLSANDIFSLIQYIHYEEELKTRKVYIPLIKVSLRDGQTLQFFAMNEVLIAGESYSNICFAVYIDEELLQNVNGTGIIIATDTGDTGYSYNTGGAINFSKNFQLICTAQAGMEYAVNERFTRNSIICSNINIVLKPAPNILVTIDGKKQNIDSEKIKSVEVSTLDKSNYINKLDLVNYSKVCAVRHKIFGY